MWRKLPNFQAEKRAQNPVTSLAVMVFSVPTIEIAEDWLQIFHMEGGAKNT